MKKLFKKEPVFIVTNHCQWEANKKNKTSYTHAIQVIDQNTGEVRFIKCGSRIQFVSGDITESFSQESYNKQV